MSDNIPHFEYDRPYVHVSYACQEYLREFFNHYGSSYKVSENEYYIYYKMPLSSNNNYIQYYEHLKPFENFGKFKKDPLADELMTLYSFVRDYEISAVNLRYGHYTEDYFQAFKSLGFIHESHIMQQLTKQCILNYEGNSTCANCCDSYLKFALENAKKNQQSKQLLDGQYIAKQALKYYGDCDIYAYYVADNILNICDYASATLYSCVLDGKGGYKLYGQHNTYGFEKELFVDPHFDSDEEESHDRLFLKHALVDNCLIMEKTVSDEVYVYSSMALVLKTILECIYMTEQENVLKS